MSDLLKVKIGGTSFLCKWEPPLPAGMEYLTYFEGIDASDNPATPISRVGPTGTYSNGAAPYGASTGTISFEGSQYDNVPALHLNYNTYIESGSRYEPAQLLQNLQAGTGSISIETILYIPTFYAQGGNSWMGISISTSNSKYFTLGINTYSGERGILVGLPGEMAITPETGFNTYRPDGSNSACVSVDDSMERRSTGIHHLAIVLDKTNGETRCYIDGAHAATMATATFSQITGITPYNSLNDTILITQFAIFSRDRSTDNGATYPVPVKPYIKF